MKLSSPRFWIAVMTAIAVVGIALVDLRRTSPGPLAEPHAREKKLAGDRSCAACHGGWFESMRSACLECHEVIEEQLAGGFGLHGSIKRELAEGCGQCHSDHHGRDFTLVNNRSFALLGVPDAQEFDHNLIGFLLNGKHDDLECSRCHEHADADPLPRGAQRFLGLDRDCASCHADPHEGRMVIACASCHGQESFDQLDSLGHERFVPLAGGHETLSCDTCHSEGSFFSLDAVGRGVRHGEPRRCADCHSSPHTEAFMSDVSALAALSPEESCRVCHLGEHVSFREEDIPLSAEQHAVSGFSLDAPHDEVACADCHLPYLPNFHDRYPGREPNDCRVCHADPHDGQFDATEHAERGCLSCHERTHFEPPAFGPDEHARTEFALTGSHLEVACEACHHETTLGGAIRFHDTGSRCEVCHEDAHAGFFERPLALARDLDAGTCAHCHATEAFDEPRERFTPEAFEHERWTGFAVDGAHAAAACVVCHPRAAEPDDTGRRFGWVEEHFGTFEGCVTCHVDPHEGAFSAWNHPVEVEGREDCARCHVTTSFRTFPDGFDHRAWTGFPLTGAHKETACAACHPPLATSAPSGRTWERARGRRCAECHVDPHAGQFARDGRTDCQRCHTARGEAFTELVFDHERHARFPLGEAHAEISCSKCHPTWEAPGGEEVVRYRPLRHECIDCHGDHVEPLRRKKGGRR